jgi:nucleoside-diphosphate-sugar epimerase
MARKVCSLVADAPGPSVGALPDRECDPPYLVADVSAAGEILGWLPTPGLEEKLCETIDWYRKWHFGEGGSSEASVR